MVLRDNSASSPVKVEIDLRHPPAVIRPAQHPELPHALSLDWDRTVDDHQHLRRCPVCRCSDLYARKPVPQVTGFLAVILAAVIAMVLFGFGQVIPATIIFATVLAVDLLILLIARRFLVCYRCRTQFRRLRVPRNHPRWDATLAEKYQDDAVHPLHTPPTPVTPPATPGEASLVTPVKEDQP
jgi:hypothetical protein